MTLRTLGAALFMVLAVVLVTRAASAERDRVQEEAIDHELAAIDPKLVAIAHDANAAMDRNDAVAAAHGYGDIHARAPGVVAITRRLGVAEARAGDANGVAHCREALAADPSAENHAALASALLQTRPMAAEVAKEARFEAVASVQLAPTAEFAQTTLCQAAIEVDDMSSLEQCTAQLAIIAPAAASTHLYTAMLRSARGDIDGAEAQLELARVAGLAPERARVMREKLEKQRAAAVASANATAPASASNADKIGSAVSVTLVSWIAGLFLVLVVGMMCSDAKKGKSEGLRSVYRGVLLLGVLWFYWSALIVGAAFFAGIAALAYAFLAMSHPSLAAKIVLGVVAFYAFVLLVRGVFVRAADENLGEAIDLEKKERALRLKLRAIAKAMRVRDIDRVFLRPNAELALVERKEISLVIGVALLEGMHERAFDALVARELAYGLGGNVGGGATALKMTRALQRWGDSLVTRGVGTLHPASLFLRVYTRFFARIARRALATREDLADAAAAKKFGASALIEGLEHWARRAADFDAHIEATIREAVDQERALANVYKFEPTSVDREAADDAFADAFETLSARVQTLRAREDDDDDDGSEKESAWSLFSDREGVERAMTAHIRTEIATSTSIVIAEG